MQLTFLVLIFCCKLHISTPNPPATWRRSRYIIDNRRNALFLKKPSTVLLPQTPEVPLKEFRLGGEPFKQRLFPVEPCHRDLAAEASISEPKFYRKYGENLLTRKLVKGYKISSANPNEYQFGIFENQKNASGVLDPQNFIQTEDAFNDVAPKDVTTTEIVPTWVPKFNDGVLVSVSSTATTSRDIQKTDVSPRPVLQFDDPTTTSYPWELSKTEQGNQIDNGNEKHVYETRIETVSYHQEVIFNSPKKQNWYQADEKSKSYELPEENYGEPEKNYEEPEENYGETEKNYEEPEKNYELETPEAEENQNKFGYVLEGENYRKYRVEERTVDGFIVGEYGVVSHDDGSLRGVRYTADGNTNPKLIYETLIKFLSL